MAPARPLYDLPMIAAYHRPPHAAQVQPWRAVADEAAAVTITTHAFADSPPVKVSALFRIEYRAGARHESVQLFIDDASTYALPDERCAVTVANTRGDTVLAITALLGHDDRGHWCAPSTNDHHAALAALFAGGENLRFELTAGDAPADGLPRTPFVTFVLAGSTGFEAVRAAVDARALEAAARPPAKPAPTRRSLRAALAGLLRRAVARRPRQTPIAAQEPMLPPVPAVPAEPTVAHAPSVVTAPAREPEPIVTEPVVAAEPAGAPPPEPEREPAVVSAPPPEPEREPAVTPPPTIERTSPPARPSQRRSWLARWREPVVEDGVLDRAAAIRRRALVAAYRRHGTRMGRAPTALTPDAAVIEVHERVTEGYARVAGERGETLTPARLQYIAWRFMETRETLGDDMLRSHLRHELRRYRTDGLRTDFQRELKFDLPA